MSTERQVIPFRAEMENALFIECVNSWFPDMKRSAVVNLIIKWCRLYSAQENVNLPQDMLQRVLCVALYTRFTNAGPRKAIRQREEQTA